MLGGQIKTAKRTQIPAIRARKAANGRKSGVALMAKCDFWDALPVSKPFGGSLERLMIDPATRKLF